MVAITLKDGSVRRFDGPVGGAEIARLVFQQLTERDAENREVRRPRPLRDLAAVALRMNPSEVTQADAAVVHDVNAGRYEAFHLTLSCAR